ncbi:hypothetical protein AMATHDRAFT_60985 [Amanita thiersii Skay4041]|uniref:F-box domain-containing protein n=1 Tax=Amanita thiersii Skay4041 TaxID=703135 RepID=A0A2A9NHI0_9AGAR|nr:hypothetical protein AMATHDRAFT_60985 [Amanita thiersii Skay4041]
MLSWTTSYQLLPQASLLEIDSTPADQSMGLNNLPYDLLLNIASYLDLHDIHTLHLTCKSLHDFASTRPVYRKLAHDLLRRCRPLPLKGFQRLSDLSTDQLIRAVNKASRLEIAWKRRTPQPIQAHDACCDIFDDDDRPESSLTRSTTSNHVNGGRDWYKVVSSPPNEEVDWLSPITSKYTLCATKSGKVVCWDVKTDSCLAEWSPEERWELWKCRVEFDQRTVFFTMARVISGSYDDNRITEFVLMRLDFPEVSVGSASASHPPTFSPISSFNTAGMVMNVFLLDPSNRLLSAFVWISSSNSIGLYVLLDWSKQEYVFIDTGIEGIMSSNWSCILFERNIVIHCEESDAAYQYFYPIPLLRRYNRKVLRNNSNPLLAARVSPARTISKTFKFPKLLSPPILPGHHHHHPPHNNPFTTTVLANGGGMLVPLPPNLVETLNTLLVEGGAVNLGQVLTQGQLDQIFAQAHVVALLHGGQNPGQLPPVPPLQQLQQLVPLQVLQQAPPPPANGGLGLLPSEQGEPPPPTTGSGNDDDIDAGPVSQAHTNGVDSEDPEDEDNNNDAHVGQNGAGEQVAADDVAAAAAGVGGGNQLNPFPVPMWFPESAHFVRQWWPTLPGVPRVSCTVVLLAMHDQQTHRTRFVLAQHYFRVPLDWRSWRETQETIVCTGKHKGKGKGKQRQRKQRHGSRLERVNGVKKIVEGVNGRTHVNGYMNDVASGGGGDGFYNDVDEGTSSSSPYRTPQSDPDQSSPVSVYSNNNDDNDASSEDEDECVCGWSGDQYDDALDSEDGDGDNSMKLWYVSTPFEVVCVLDGDEDDDDGQPVERPRPLVAVDFGHAVWIEYVDDAEGEGESENPENAGGQGVGGSAGASAGIAAGSAGANADIDALFDTEGMDADEEDENLAYVPTVGGFHHPAEAWSRHPEPKRLRFVTFPEYGSGGTLSEGVVHTLEVPDELDLHTVETINIDQSQGAVILSVRDGKIFILCYE